LTPLRGLCYLGSVKTVMTIAGSDSGGGAGIQADLKTFAALGVYGTSALTAVTAQNTLGVTAVHEVPPEVVAVQIDAVVSDIGADAVKTGMLASVPIIEIVAAKLRQYRLPNLVVDPVMVAKSGDRLLRPEAVAALRELLLPLATVVTPNLPEAEILVGRPLPDDEAVRDAAREIVALGPRAVVMKGGHAAGDVVVDVLFDGVSFREYAAPRVDTRSTHGTGCTFASAIAAGLAQGLGVEEAVAQAKEYVTAALRNAKPIGGGHGPVHHFYGFWKE
jgi:hydroxymethylpyrimidine/phosphomethylpyrimidine kinase